MLQATRRGGRTVDAPIWILINIWQWSVDLSSQKPCELWYEVTAYGMQKNRPKNEGFIHPSGFCMNKGDGMTILIKSHLWHGLHAFSQPKTDRNSLKETAANPLDESIGSDTYGLVLGRVAVAQFPWCIHGTMHFPVWWQLQPCT